MTTMGGPLQHLFCRLAAGNRANIRNAIAPGGDPHPQFWQSSDVPLFAVISKPLHQRPLHFGMIEFAPISFLQLAVNVVAIRTVAAVQIFANRDRQPRCC